MGYWINGGLFGVIVILFLSIALTPAFCNTMKVQYNEVSCHLKDNLNTFTNI